MSKHYAIIPAAGQGLRFGRGVKKQFRLLSGKSLLEWTLDTFRHTKLFHKIVVCLPADEMTAFSAHVDPLVHFVVGGSSRVESVYRGYRYLKELEDEDKVLVHDAVRPLVSQDLIKKVALETTKKGAVIPCLPVTDTMKKVQDGRVMKTVDRTNLQAVQTPQGFTGRILKRIFREPPVQGTFFTDEAMLAEAAEIQVWTVEGERTNIKVTTEFDFKLAEFLMGREKA